MCDKAGMTLKVYIKLIFKKILEKFLNKKQSEQFHANKHQ